MFAADAEAEQAGWQVLLAWDGGAALDGGLDGAEAGGVAHDGERLTDAIGRGGTTTDIEGDERAEAAEGAGREIVLRVAGEAGVADALDAGGGFEACGDVYRAGLAGGEAEGERARAARGQERFEHAGRGAGEFAGVDECFVQVVGLRDGDAAEEIGVPTDVLGDGVDDDVGAERERLLVQGRGDGVVDGADRTGLARGGADGGEVGDFEQRVGGRLQPEQIGAGCVPEPGGGVGGGEAVEGPSPLSDAALGERDDAGIAVGGDDDVRGRGELIKDGGDRADAGGESDGAATFEPAHDGLERVPRGGAVVAGVGAARAEDEVGGGDEGGVERCAGREVAASGDQPGVGMDAGGRGGHGGRV